MNGAMFNPQDKSLVISVRPNDVKVFPDMDEGLLVIAVANLDDGIEIFHDSDAIWWPV
jgi:hypothetical protein